MTNLSIRKQKILCLLVARYIETAEPVSSSDIKDDYGEETMAYLVQVIAGTLCEAHMRWLGRKEG